MEALKIEGLIQANRMSKLEKIRNKTITEKMNIRITICMK